MVKVEALVRLALRPWAVGDALLGETKFVKPPWRYCFLASSRRLPVTSLQHTIYITVTEYNSA